MLGVLCGMQTEAAVIKKSDDVTVYTGLANLWSLHKACASKQITGLVSFGTCGALIPYLDVGNIFVATSVIGIHRLPTETKWVNKLPRGYKTGPMLSLGKDVTAVTPAQRQALYKQYGAMAVDQESQAVAELAYTYDIPYVVIRCVSDDANTTLPPAALNSLNADGSISGWRVFTSIISNPLQIAALIKMNNNLQLALKNLGAYFEKAHDALVSY
jgi:adenosylhomocysteine nucleosidase